MKYKKKAFSRDERKEHVMGQFAIWQSKGDNELKTMTRIARSLDMSPSQHVTDILLELVEEGKLAFVEREKAGRWTARGYYSTIKTLITEKWGKRRIIVKHKGVESGQLEMWS